MLIFPYSPILELQPPLYPVSAAAHRPKKPMPRTATDARFINSLFQSELFHPPQRLIELRHIEGFRIKLAADPFDYRVVFLVLRIGQRFEQIFVSGRAAAILRGAGAFAIDAVRIVHGGFRRQDFLDFDFVLPAVAEVVVVEKAAALLGNAVEPGVALVFCVAGEIRIRHAVILIADPEGMQMTVGPAHGGL